MFTPQQLEQMIRATGGVPVVIGDASTWGQLDRASEAFGAAGSRSTEGGTPPEAQMLTLPDGLTERPSPGGQILVDGTPRVVRAWRLNGPGDELLVLLASRTHVVSLYALIGSDAEDGWGNPVESWWELVAENVAANFEPDSGGVVEDIAGQSITALWRGFIPAGIPVQPGYGVLVTVGAGPLRYRVTHVADHGPNWDQEVHLRATAEVFP